ncbi:hypothetical protein EYF80_023240 [Liparis tanakae]|uniref:Uncharacterized protein n=1 Tax=Liparis tanakae TaxID=230148 RepID=A0A4Z2HNL7_9TELE|nr:hypothetical protein EYF80_023240 [Liparis tanakae]
MEKDGEVKEAERAGGQFMISRLLDGSREVLSHDDHGHPGTAHVLLRSGENQPELRREDTLRRDALPRLNGTSNTLSHAFCSKIPRFYFTHLRYNTLWGRGTESRRIPLVLTFDTSTGRDRRLEDMSLTRSTPLVSGVKSYSTPWTVSL